MSTLTSYTPIPEDSRGTPGLWDRRFATMQQNVESVNADLFTPSGNTFSFGTYAISASTASFLGALIPAASLGTVQAWSGNTVTLMSHLSMNNRRIEMLGEPSGTSDAATKHYVDAAAGGKLTYYADPTAYHTTSNSTVTLSLLTIAAGKLATNGDMVRIRAWGDCGTTVSGVVQITLAFGAEQLTTFSSSGGTLNFRFDSVVMRTGAATERGEGYVVRAASIVGGSQVSLTGTLANALPVWVCQFNQSGLNTVSTNVLGLTAEVVQQ